MGFYKDMLSRDGLMMASVSLVGYHSICAANRGANIPAVTNDTGVLSSTWGTHDSMIGMILARRTDGKIAAAPWVLVSVMGWMCVCLWVVLRKVEGLVQVQKAILSFMDASIRG